MTLKEIHTGLTYILVCCPDRLSPFFNQMNPTILPLAIVGHNEFFNLSMTIDLGEGKL